MTDLANLVVKLSAETSQYTQSLNQATQTVQKFATDVGNIAGDIAKKLAGAFAVEQFAEYTKNVIEQEAQLGKLAQVVGTTTEALSQLQRGARLVGVEDFTTPIERFSKALGQVSEGGAAEFGASLKAIG